MGVVGSSLFHSMNEHCGEKKVFQFLFMQLLVVIFFFLFVLGLLIFESYGAG